MVFTAPLALASYCARLQLDQHHGVERLPGVRRPAGRGDGLRLAVQQHAAPAHPGRHIDRGQPARPAASVGLNPARPALPPYPGW